MSFRNDKVEKLYIPEKIKVGYQEREGTYTGKLAYVIYYDHKGVLRKEKSWQSWISDKITPDEFENTPMDGFVLNKGVGGNRNSYGWNTRNEYIRVYDPRNFEFEISVANLLFILRECDCSKGKGLEGKFVYAWHGTELVLLPTIAQDYTVSVEHTQLQKTDVSAKELIKGATYIAKDGEALIYIDRLKHYENRTTYYSQYGRMEESTKSYCKKKYIFYSANEPSEDKSGYSYRYRSSDRYKYLNDLKKIATLKSELIAPNYAELVDGYMVKTCSSKIVKLFTKERTDKNQNKFYVEKDNKFYEFFISTETNLGYYYRTKAIGVEWMISDACYRLSSKNTLVQERYTMEGIANQENPSFAVFTQKLEEEFRTSHYNNYYRNSVNVPRYWSLSFRDSCALGKTGNYVSELFDFMPDNGMGLWVLLENGREVEVGKLYC